MLENNLTNQEIDTLLLDLIKLHLPIVNVDEEDFMDLLKNSLSLSVSEKKRVIDAIPTLSQFQFDELKKVFLEERIKFRELAWDHPEDITKLVKKQQEEWLELWELYIIEKQKVDTYSEEQKQIDDLKANFWL